MQKTLRHYAAIALLLAACVARGQGDDSALPKNLHAELNPPAVPGVSVQNLKATTAEIEWPAGLSPADEFRIEVRRFSLDAARELQMQWEEFRGATIARRGETYHARLKGLVARQPYWIRVLPQGSAAASTEPLFTVRFQTPATTSVFTGRRATIAGLLLTLAALVWLRWRQSAA